MKHCSDFVLLAYMDSELPYWRRTVVKRHLGRCWRCRARQFEMEARVRTAARLVGGEDFLPPERVAAAKQSFEEWQKKLEAGGRTWNPLLAAGRWRREAGFGLAAAALLICGLALGEYGRPRAVQASTLLVRSAALQEALAGPAPQVVHRTLHLEERAGGKVERRRIEVWQEGPPSRGGGRQTRRVYDEGGRLLACERTTPAGARTVYRRDTQPLTEYGADRAPVAAPDSIESAGRMELSAREFAALLEDVNQAVVEQTAAAFVVRYQAPPGTAAAASRLLSAAVVLSRRDLRAIEQRLVVEREDQAREYRLFETRFNRYPSGMIAAAMFDPDPELLAPAPVAVTAAAVPVIEAPAAAPPAPPQPAPVPVDPALEVGVISLLAQANITLGEHAVLERMPDGGLVLRLTLDHERQKRRALEALAELLDRPGLPLRVEFTLRASPFQVVPTAGLAERARRSKGHALALSQVGGRFTAAQIAGMDEDSRAQWLTVLGQHAQAFGYETTTLIQELRAALPDVPLEDEEAIDEESADPAELGPAVDRLAELATEQEAIVRSALSGMTAIDGPRLVGSLRRAVRLAAAIQAAVAVE